MLYHFRLIDHFTGKAPLNLPFFLHRSLTKVCNKVKAKPHSIKNVLCHFGLIKMIILEELRQKERTWQHFVFWEGFETQTQPKNENKKAGKKQPTPQSISRRRRALPKSLEEKKSSSKPKKAKKKLDFKTNPEQSTVKKENVLNLPYTDSDTKPEKDDEILAIKSLEHFMEPAQDLEVFTSFEEGGTSRKKKTDDSRLIKKLRKKIKQHKVLERVIKERYEILSKNFVETDKAFERLALKTVREKKRKKKILADKNRFLRIARCLKIKNKSLKAKLVASTPLKLLAETIGNLVED
jgi:hypothetical protein